MLNPCMSFGKASYLRRLTSKMRFRSVDIGEKLEGSSPPGVFIGKWNYPKVYIGPMLTPQEGDTSLLDTPEAWLFQQKQLDDIIQFRLQLVRGKQMANIHDLDNKLVQQVQEISLADGSIDAEAQFTHKPRGFFFNEEHQPFGPSAQLRKFDTGNVKWEPHLEKVYYDTDFKAADSMIQLYQQGLPFSQIQKALSTASMGIGKNRKLVPTRWSITALDDTLGKHLLDAVRYNEILDGYEVYEFSAMHNHFTILLTPTPWQYEWMEAFIHVLDREEVIFSDWEGFHGKKQYSSVGGCFYSVRFAVAEKLKNEQKQAGAIVFREAYPGYVPLGVWLCREETRQALSQPPKKFEDLHSALNHIASNLRLPITNYYDHSRLLKDMLSGRQMLLSAYRA